MTSFGKVIQHEAVYHSVGQGPGGLAPHGVCSHGGKGNNPAIVAVFGVVKTFAAGWTAFVQRGIIHLSRLSKHHE